MDIRIIKENEADTKNYKELDNKEQFLLETEHYKFFAIKINESYACIINAENEFVPVNIRDGYFCFDYIVGYADFEEINKEFSSREEV